MAKLFDFPPTGTTGDPKPPAPARKTSGTSRIPQSIRESVSRMFYDCRRSVRKIQSFYRVERVSERDVEDIIRDAYRERIARAMNIGRLRAA